MSEILSKYKNLDLDLFCKHAPCCTKTKFKRDKGKKIKKHSPSKCRVVE